MAGGDANPDAVGVRTFLQSSLHSDACRRIILIPSLHRVGTGVAVGSFDGAPGAVMTTADLSA